MCLSLHSLTSQPSSGCFSRRLCNEEVHIFNVTYTCASDLRTIKSDKKHVFNVNDGSEKFASEHKPC